MAPEMEKQIQDEEDPGQHDVRPDPPDEDPARRLTKDHRLVHFPPFPFLPPTRPVAMISVTPVVAISGLGCFENSETSPVRTIIAPRKYEI